MDLASAVLVVLVLPQHRLLSNFSKTLEQAVQDQQLVLVWEFRSFRNVCAYLGQLIFISGQLEDSSFIET